MEGPVPGLLADGGALRGVDLADGRTLQAAGVFLLPRRIPNGGVLEGLCCERAPGHPLILDFQHTARTDHLVTSPPGRCRPSEPGTIQRSSDGRSTRRIAASARGPTPARVSIRRETVGADTNPAVVRVGREDAIEDAVGQHPGQAGDQGGIAADGVAGHSLRVVMALPTSGRRRRPGCGTAPPFPCVLPASRMLRSTSDKTPFSQPDTPTDTHMRAVQSHSNYQARPRA